MLSKKFASLRWSWDHESDSLIAYTSFTAPAVISSFYSIEWQGDPDKWIAYFEGVELGKGTLQECLKYCGSDYSKSKKGNKK